ncbi:MAG: hypothetical protein RJA22_1304 [Verrucomicrobiota bacterium]
MLKEKSFLAVDFGATNLKVAEFEITEAGGLSLRNYVIRSLGQDGTQEATREATLQRALTEILEDKAFTARRVNVCAPGFNTFSKFVKLPQVDTSKVSQIIQYEAQQNVPFPLEEVVWDYYILGVNATNEMEVLLVAIKSDIVEGLFRTAEKSGLELSLVDASPAALSNSFRFNYGDLEGCTMLLDIGARTSNLLFFEKGKMYARGINIGANSITQEFSKESKMPYDEAEQLKIEQGFVSLGGAYEEPDNPNQAAISKIARQVLSRLHIQVNQTIQFYRGQQGGSLPERLYLSGGATSMPYTAQFFAEKLNLPVEYFNPLRNVEIDPAVNREELLKVAHSLGEVVGLGLRNLARCPVELNLMPKSSKRRQDFAKRKPYLAAAALCLVLIVWAWGLFYSQVASEKETALNMLREAASPLASSQQLMERAMTDLKVAHREVDQYTAWLEDKSIWNTLFGTLRSSLIAVEEKKAQELSNRNVGVWIEQLAPILPKGYLSVSIAPPPGPGDAAGAVAPPPGEPPAGGPPLGRGGPGGRFGRPGGPAGSARLGGAGGSGEPELSELLLTCKAVNLSRFSSTDNTKLATAVVEEFKTHTNLFNPAQTRIVGDIVGIDSTNLTISFQVMLRLARPIKL